MRKHAYARHRSGQHRVYAYRTETEDMSGNRKIAKQLTLDEDKDDMCKRTGQN